MLSPTEVRTSELLMIREQIKNLILKAIKRAQQDKKLSRFKTPEIIVDHPIEKEHGDYASNVAMSVGTGRDLSLQKKPRDLAEIIKAEIEQFKESEKMFEKIEVAGSGFLNFYLKKEFVQKQVGEILKQGEEYGQFSLGTRRAAFLQSDKKIQVEFISANPTGPLTVGNARGGPLGDCLANILEKAGYQVKRAYYVNDRGNQILKLGHSVLKDREAVYKGKYIDKLHQKIKQKDPAKAGQAAAKIIINDYIKKTVKRAGIKFDKWYFESELYQSGQVDKILDFLKKKKLLYKKEDAIWFKSSKFGDQRDRVLVKSDDQKTYLVGDLALHNQKFKKDKFSKVIDIWGADHAGDVVGLRAGVEALGHKNKLDIVLLQFVTLLEKGKQRKISKRSGTLVTLDELLNEVGADVLRFFFLQKSANTHLSFDLDLAKEQSEKNPVFYIQYAFARIHSILAKSKIKNQKSKVQIKSQNLELLEHASELELIKQLINLPEIINDISHDYQVHRLPHYAMDLAAAFHRFYKNCRVLGNDDKNLDQARLALISAAKIVLKNTLDLMGISAPEKM